VVNTMNDKPLYIGVVTDYTDTGPHDLHQVFDKYIAAVTVVMEAVPIVFPVLGHSAPIDAWLEIVDGIILPGAYSNIEPHHYRGQPSDPGAHHDPRRDATTLTLINKAIESDVPVLGICRGFQEINVALGGTLYSQVKDVPGMSDHTEDKEQSLEEQYGLAHSVTLINDGMLAGAMNQLSMMVNSLHQQGVESLSDLLKAEAVAKDGLVEAFSLVDQQRFVLGVQWHPEWQVTTQITTTPHYRLIFDLFKNACSKRKPAL
jgi:putative glutamine amidotransferase